jgi:hypothetical protein
VEFLKSKHFFGDYAATTDVQIEDLKYGGLTWIVFVKKYPNKLTLKGLCRRR